MKKIVLLTAIALFAIKAYSQAPTPPKGYQIKQPGLYTPKSGGDGRTPICTPDPDKICILVKAKTTTSYWDPLSITSATLEFPSYQPGVEIQISSISSVSLPNGDYAISWTVGQTWTGPFALVPGSYNVTLIP